LSAPYQRIVCVDFETRWDKADYTLSKMTTEEYIRDNRFKAFGACVHEYGSGAAIQWYRGDELHRIFSGIDWGRTAVLAHNAQFDVSIMEWRYGLAIPSRNSQVILVFPKKGKPFTQPMDSVNWILRLRPNLLRTADTTSFYVKQYSGSWSRDIHPRNSA